MESDNFITDRDALMCLELLSNHPVFSAFPTNDLLELIGNCTIRSYAKSEVIVQEGELVDAVYFILQGQCEVRKRTVNAADEPIEQPVAILREEESIGLSKGGLFSTTGNRTATIVALSEVKTLCLNIAIFQRFLENHVLTDEVLSTQLALLTRMNFIKSVAPFASISHQNLQQIAKKIEEKSFPSNTTLFEQGDPGDACYIVVSGKVDISVSSGEGERKTRAELEEGAIFGELALMHDTTRMATARTLEATKLLIITRSLFKEITQQNVKTYEALMQLQLKHCRPLKLDNIEVYKQKSIDGLEISLLKNPALGKYLQLSEQELFLWNLLDGESSINEIAIHFFLQFRVLNVEEIAAQIMKLSQAGFVLLQPTENANQGWQPEVMTKLRKKLDYKIIFENTDEWMNKMFHHFGWIFYTKPVLLLGILIAVGGLTAFLIDFGEVVVLLGDSPYKWGWFALAILLVTLCNPLYQLAHAFTTKHYGRKVHCFGLGWSGFAPFAYCDTSDMWLSPKKQRVMVDLAGIYLNLVLAGIAALAGFLMPSSYPSAIFFLEVVAFGFYVMVIANLDTVFERDGYYALIDALEKPNLRLSSIKWGRALFSEKHATLLGILANIKNHRKEAIYCLCTLLNLLVIHMVLPYIVLTYLLMGVLGLNSLLLVALLTLIVFVFSSFSLYKDLSWRLHSVHSSS